MNILGYAGLNHDPGAAVVIDGAVASAIESEKVTRAKHEMNVFPEAAMRAALEIAGLAFEDIDVIATNYAASAGANGFYLPLIARMIRDRTFDFGLIANLVVIAGSHHERMFRRLPERRLPKIVNVRHHRAHLATSFLLSPHEEAAVAIIDAAGETDCTTTWACAGRSVRKLTSMDAPCDSLGAVYALATRRLGYRMMSDEYKVMGLAALGSPDPVYRQFFEKLIELLPEGRYRVSRRLIGRLHDGGWKFPHAVDERLGPGRTEKDTLDERHAAFAFELQRRLEEAVLHVVRHLKSVTGAKALCLGGGVALNCVANGKIRAEGGFDDVFVPPAPHDAGTALGAALHHHFYDLGGRRPEPMTSACLGPAFDDEVIERELKRAQQDYRRCDDICDVSARALAAGAVIGWFQGRGEFGPRALGARSILADPRPAGAKDRVNRLVKERESYRPFAPAIIEAEAPTYFQDGRPSPWMLFVDVVREAAREKMPAVVHVDGTARPQTVSNKDDALFGRLLGRFFEFTGMPALLNTSFNVAGEPIVHTPSDALRCFHGSGLDALALGSFWLAKPLSPFREIAP